MRLLNGTAKTISRVGVKMGRFFKRLFMSDDEKAEMVFGVQEEIWYLRKDMEALEKRVEALETKKGSKK